MGVAYSVLATGREKKIEEDCVHPSTGPRHQLLKIVLPITVELANTFKLSWRLPALKPLFLMKGFAVLPAASMIVFQ